jgi:hypothetical protein
MFDFFDTIFFRKQGDWKDFLLFLGRDLIENNTISIKTPGDFVQKRLAVELLAAKFYREKKITLSPTLKQIYSHGIDQFFSGGVEGQSFYEYEFLAEKKHGYVPSYICDYFHELIKNGKKIVIVSNTYYTALEIKDILYSCSGLSYSILEKIDVYTSADCRTNKQNNLFGVVKDSLFKLLGPVEIIHTGDNFELDVEKPRQFDIKTIHSLSKSALNVSERLKARSIRLPTQLRIAGSRYALRKVDSANYSKAEYIASVFAPSMYFFSKFIGNRKIIGSHLYFLEREGVSIRRFYCAHNGIDPAENADSELLSVSRFSLSPLVLLTNDNDTIRETCQRIASKSGKKDEAVLEALKISLNSVLDFVSSKFKKNQNYTLIDFGYKGTISKLLKYAIEHLGLNCTVRTIFVFNDSNTDYESIDVHTCFDQNHLKTNVLKSAKGAIGLFEELLMPNFGSVVAYSNNSVVREASSMPVSQIETREDLMQLTLSIVRELTLSCTDVTSVDVIALNEIMLESFSYNDIISEFSDWSHEINLGSNKKINIFPSIENITGLLCSEGKIKRLLSATHLIRSQLSDLISFNFSASYEMTMSTGDNVNYGLTDSYYFPGKKPIIVIDAINEVGFSILKVSYKPIKIDQEMYIEIYYVNSKNDSFKRTAMLNTCGKCLLVDNIEIYINRNIFVVKANSIYISNFECAIFSA